MLKIGLIKEGKVPPDSRVVLPPAYAQELMEKYPELLIVVVEDYENRCFSNEEYKNHNIEIVHDVSDCDLLLGVKEVPAEKLIAGKTYMFFSHTIKKQEHNKHLLKEIIRKKIRLIDYECLHDEKCVRLIGFGRFAGIVGAQHALVMWGLKSGNYSLKRAAEYHDIQEMFSHYDNTDFGTMKILITGNGRVSKGAAEVLKRANIMELSAYDYLNYSGNKPVFCICDMDVLYEHKNHEKFEFEHFFIHPEEFRCVFDKFSKSTDILINGMYWNPRAERLFEKNAVKNEDFRISVISDISCDINGSVPLTSHASTIAEPYFAFDRQTLINTKPFSENSLSLMTIDNLPNELPRDASEHFARVMIDKILPLFFENPQHEILHNATIAEHGKLGQFYQYLESYIESD